MITSRESNVHIANKSDRHNPKTERNPEINKKTGHTQSALNKRDEQRLGIS